MSLIASSRSSISSLNYLRPLYAALPLIFARATATTTVRQFSTPVRTFNRLQSSAARQTPLSSVATAIIRHLSSSPIGTRGFNSKATLAAKESKKITWVIQNFSSLQSNKSIRSDQFVVGGCKWVLKAYPRGCSAKSHLALYLEVSNYETLPYGWRIHARHLLTVLNQNSNKTVKHKVLQQWYDKNSPDWGTSHMLPLDQLEAKDSGFLVNGELKIVTEIDVFEVIGKLDETSTSIVTEIIDVNGFELLPSQAKSMSRVFTIHPETASKFRLKNATLRTCYMSFLLGMVETMCQSPQDLSTEDMSSAYAAVKIMTEAGFKLDWLRKRLDEMAEYKEIVKVSDTQLQNTEDELNTQLHKMEDELKDLKMKYLDVEATAVNWQAQVTALVKAMVEKERRRLGLQNLLSYSMMLYNLVYL